MPTGLPAGKTEANSDWFVDFSNFRQAWALTPPTGGKSMGEGIEVVHPDTGYTEHPELLAGGRYFTSEALTRNFYRPRYIARDRLLETPGCHPSHGTSTASVMMSSEGHPNLPPPNPPAFPSYTETAAVTGVAPMVKVLPCQVTTSVLLDDQTDAALAKAIYWAIGRNDVLPNTIGVISISLGRPSFGGIKDTIINAIRAARLAGIVVCGAAGQGATWFYPGPVYPGRDANVICVAACDSQHQMLDNGRYGTAVDITAPGVNVWMAKAKRLNGTPVQTYFVRNDGVGTSYATAIVAGACAMWQAFHGRANLLTLYSPPNLFYAFREVLRRSCDTGPGVWNSGKHGFGVLDAHALLTEPLPTRAEIDALALIHGG